MKVEEFESYLTEEELEMFKERLDVEAVGDYKTFIKESKDLIDAISGAFNWGWVEIAFWYEISQRKQPVR